MLRKLQSLPAEWERCLLIAGLRIYRHGEMRDESGPMWSCPEGHTLFLRDCELDAVGQPVCPICEHPDSSGVELAKMWVAEAIVATAAAAVFWYGRRGSGAIRAVLTIIGAAGLAFLAWSVVIAGIATAAYVMSRRESGG